jgi:PTH2 family peptidyl-tRNA hydrolase
MEEKRLVIRINKNLKMSPHKAAAQAVHAALMLVDAHPGTPVIVLTGGRQTVLDQEVHVVDEGRTEIPPGSITAGASWGWKEVDDDAL